MIDALHASAPAGHKCADCTMDKEPCPACYTVWWQKRHPNTVQWPQESVQNDTPARTNLGQLLHDAIDRGFVRSERGDAARNAALEEAAYLVSVEAAVPKLTTNEMHARLQQIAGHIRDMKRHTGNEESKHG